VLLLPSHSTEGFLSASVFEKLFSQSVAGLKISITFALPLTEGVFIRRRDLENYFQKRLQV